MADDPRDILRLKRCPECDYDLRGLPYAHNCPECGIEYDENIFDLQVWLDGSSASRRFDSFAYLVLVLAFGWLFVFRRAWILSHFLVVMMAGFVGFGVAGAVNRFLSKRRKHGNAKILCTPDGLSLCLGPRRLFHHWSQLNLLRVTRAAGGKWRFRLAYRWPRRFFTEDICFVISGTKREAALLRREFRRQIAPTHSGAPAL